MTTRILLADEYQIIRQELRTLLEKEPDFIVVAEADTGEAVVRSALAAEPEVIILDLDLIKGPAPIHQLMAVVPAAKVIGLSMHADRRFVLEVLKAGANGYILKEHAFEELPKAIRTVQAHKTYISHSLFDTAIQDYIDLLRDSEIRFRTIFESCPIGIALLDEKSRIVENNPALQVLLGYRQDDLFHQDLTESLQPEEAAKYQDLFKDLVAGNRESYRMDVEYRRQDGRLAWGRLSVSSIRGTGREGQLAISLLEEINDRKQAEDKLHDYQEKLLAVAQQLSLTEETERRRLANGFHDMGQLLALVQIKLGALRQSVPASQTGSLDEIRQILGESIRSVRSLGGELSPQVLYELGFESAIQWLAEKLQEQHGIQFTVGAGRSPKPLNDEVRVFLFHLMRELLTNLVIYAKPNKVSILINRVDLHISITIENDWSAATPLPSSDDLWFFGIRERLQYLGGSLEVEFSPDQRSKMSLMVPLVGKLPTAASAKLQSRDAARTVEPAKAEATLRPEISLPEMTEATLRESAEPPDRPLEPTVELSELIKAEEALRQSAQRITDLIDFLPDPTLAIDREGKVIVWNKAVEGMTGFKAEDMLGQDHYRDAFPFYGDRRPMLLDLAFKPQEELKKYPEVKRDGPSLAAETFFPMFKGRAAHFYEKVNLLRDSQKNIIGAVESFSDITNCLKAAEEHLRSNKLESLSTLAGGIAHDFNNILTPIMGNIGLAMLDGKMEPQVQARLVQAEKACRQAQDLARQLLAFAKGGAPVKTVISIANLLKESAVVALSRRHSGCELSLPDDLWPVEADEEQIKQVISILLTNADQAMPEGGMIKITAENLLTEGESDLPIPRGKYVKLTFADKGVGIPPECLDKIFDPYFFRKEPGSGLGLATAYSIIKNHSGHIQVESQEGVGTTFHITLPATEKGVPAGESPTLHIPPPALDQPVPAEVPAADNLAMGQGKVLVMDDEALVREVLGVMLSRLGYEPDFASDGSQAIEKYARAKEAEQPFDAVIMDLTIPGGMGGKEAIKELLKIDPQVKAIVSSGYADEPEMADFQNYGFREVIVKPYTVSKLSKILQKVIPTEKAN